MHAITVIATGLMILGVLVVGVRWLRYDAGSSRHTATTVFPPFWGAATLVDLWFGVTYADYTVAEETPIQLVVFLVPTAVALLLRRNGT